MRCLNFGKLLANVIDTVCAKHRRKFGERDLWLAAKQGNIHTDYYIICIWAWYNDMDVTESFEVVKIAADADEYFDAVSFGNYYIFVAR